jgi:hypothetical protein
MRSTGIIYIAAEAPAKVAISDGKAASLTISQFLLEIPFVLWRRLCGSVALQHP